MYIKSNEVSSFKCCNCNEVSSYRKEIQYGKRRIVLRFTCNKCNHQQKITL